MSVNLKIAQRFVWGQIEKSFRTNFKERTLHKREFL